MNAWIVVPIFPVFTVICVLVMKWEVRRCERRSQEVTESLRIAERSLMTKVNWKNCEVRRGRLYGELEKVHKSLDDFKIETLKELGGLDKKIGMIITKLEIEDKG